MKKFFEEFKTFIARGNVIDLAIGMIIGSAFTAIVTSLVNDMLMPLIGTIMGGIDLSNLSIEIPWNLAGDPVYICYGNFLQAILNFVIIAFCIFMLVKVINKFVKKKEAPPAGPTKDQELLTEIRDLLKAQAASKADEKKE
ncbi:MAG: large-conductance mechanosensitive channel protein MscL [Ruminococcus sp.]|nr:large-conductance mechanosensitive channel protein MscL [Ruminococcus sp.]